MDDINITVNKLIAMTHLFFHFQILKVLNIGLLDTYSLFTSILAQIATLLLISKT